MCLPGSEEDTPLRKPTLLVLLPGTFLSEGMQIRLTSATDNCKRFHAFDSSDDGDDDDDDDDDDNDSGGSGDDVKLVTAIVKHFQLTTARVLPPSHLSFTNLAACIWWLACYKLDDRIQLHDATSESSCQGRPCSAPDLNAAPDYAAVNMPLLQATAAGVPRTRPLSEAFCHLVVVVLCTCRRVAGACTRSCRMLSGSSRASSMAWTTLSGALKRMYSSK
eukprot:1142103-Pelagomonas_calceolata.AAC.9